MTVSQSQIRRVTKDVLARTLLGPMLGIGKLWYVDSTNPIAINGDKGVNGPDVPFATLAYAVSVASAGDTILVARGQTESVPATDLTVDKAGLTIIGDGFLDQRPLITLAATGSTIAVTGDNVSLQNLRFTTGADSVDLGITVTGAGFSMIDCAFDDAASTQIDQFLQLSGGRPYIAGLVYRGDASAGTAAAIVLTAATGAVIERCDIDGNFSAAPIQFATTATANVRIRDSVIWNRNAADVCILDTITGSTGIIGPDLELSLADNAANVTEAITGATFRVMDPVYVVNQNNEKAMLINWTATTDA